MDELDRKLECLSQQNMSLAKSDDRQSTRPITCKNSILVTAQVHHPQTYDPKEHKTPSTSIPFPPKPIIKYKCIRPDESKEPDIMVANIQKQFQDSKPS